MASFYICRHGETENNKNKILSGWHDSPLTQLGTQNALSSSEKLKVLKIDKIISSDLGRAFNTASIIADQIKYQGKIEKYEGLREVGYGDLAGRPYADYPDVTPEQNSNYAPPGGESLSQMQARAIDCLDRVNSANHDLNILVVGHDGTINAVRASFLNISAGEADLTHNPHDAVFKFLIDNKKVTSFEKI